ncbi:uncharacterized protein LOC105229818 [Bactrocera dorsalis]|uniref:Uncharacterized protein LOC105229818 n=1 Tax=Bactrocera dorsalis TaxID=27457 RepID=A0A6I9VD68_BACDO|nr:uncharacterized protein LOC105229818 [Bactrocera dorsalis]
MKATTLTVLGSILVLSLLKDVTYAYTVNLNFPSKPGFSSRSTLNCNRGYHIVVRKAILFHNGNMRNERASYPPKMACDLEQTCNFELVREQYNYLSPAPAGDLELTINYDCKRDNFQGNPRRITDYGKTEMCPQDSFVQKHVAYFNDDRIASDSQQAKTERELIAMSVCAQVRRFRERNPNAPIDPYLGTVFLIHEKNSRNPNFMPSPGNNRKCQLTANALARSYRYDCRRDAIKWTCNYGGKEIDVAKHDKYNSHLD